MGSEYDREVDQYVRLLTGEEKGTQYKNSTLMIRDSSKKSVYERSKNDICPPTRLNDDYYQPAKKTPQQARSQQRSRSQRRVDPEFLDSIRYSSY